ncbi:DNA replication licensing factor, putative [Toxoplasma gondii ME49]|uniref:DNA replication licensing factor MCM2 n=4 Tax=Toxoplasma gondii TaxID=5811 RepID=A0A086JV35_TOXGO|nr:DNA replication licensing factor, putative [Toxoplasma gondii ME49]EPT26496.1 DNA replication licensing factor, putative [Toxoplasma gondii ME49]KFG36003.1 putative DNA replication licensing factor [Toxoplasma gondii GAB2-2007-GAL-DOM2]|eukprot:XP_002370818.1 DNA replication licensing factor, putative [Toxoplasma gondii ME49]
MSTNRASGLDRSPLRRTEEDSEADVNADGERGVVLSEVEEEDDQGRLRGGVLDENVDYFQGSRELDLEERRAEEEAEKIIDEENTEDLVFGMRDDEREREAFLAAGMDADAFDASLIDDEDLDDLDPHLEEKARRAAERHLDARENEARRKRRGDKAAKGDIWAQLLEEDDEGASEMDRVLRRVEERRRRFFSGTGMGGRGSEQINLHDLNEAKKLLTESNPALVPFGEQHQQAMDTLFKYFLYKFNLHAFRRVQHGGVGEEEEGEKRDDEKALYYLDRIQDMIREDRATILVDTRHLIFFSDQLVKWIEAYPLPALQVMNDVITVEAEASCPSLYSTRICSVILTDWPYKEELRQLRCTHLNSLISVSGVVTRRSSVLPKMRLLYLKCSNCLNSITDVPIQLVEGRKNDAMPRKCPHCQGSRFIIDRVKTAFVDFQRLTLQESPGKVPPGRPPRQREVIITGELVDSIKPGEEVDVLGIYQTKCDYSLNAKTGFPILATEILANNVVRTSDARMTEFTEEDLKAIKQLSRDPHIRERILASIAPALWGNREVKTAIAYALFGGVPKGRGPSERGQDGNDLPGSLLMGSSRRTAWGKGASDAAQGIGAREEGGSQGGTLGSSPHTIRGDINVLLLGDPGLGKSQALQYVARTFPRTVCTTGKGASAVGLTAGVRKDPQTGEWTLEGGALVLADEGICLIDEFDKMVDRDRVSIHEAMEQQSISISKAGIVTTLRARCSVIAAANPKFGRYIPSYTFKENVDLSDPILSRFDIIAVLRDVPDADEDHYLAEYVLTHHQLAHPNISHLENYQQRMEELEHIMLGNQAYEPIPQDLLQKYILYARANCRPVLDPSVNSVAAKVSSFYARLRRRAAATGGLPLTLRHVEALLRMAEANAKMRLSPVVSSTDVDYAIATLLDSFISSQKFAVQQRLGREFARYRALARGGWATLSALLRRLMQQRLQRVMLQRAGAPGAELEPLSQADFDSARRVKVPEFVKVAAQNKFAAYQVEAWMASSHFTEQFRVVQEGEDKTIVSLNWSRPTAAAEGSG